MEAQLTISISLFSYPRHLPEDDFSILLSRFAPPSTAEPNLHLLAPQTATSSTSLASHLHLPSILHRKGPSSESGSIKNGHGGGSGSGGLNGSGIGSRKSQALAAAKAKELKHQKEFENFHGQNGVRTVLGSIGPVKNGELISRRCVGTVEGVASLSYDAGRRNES